MVPYVLIPTYDMPDTIKYRIHAGYIANQLQHHHHGTNLYYQCRNGWVSVIIFCCTCSWYIYHQVQQILDEKIIITIGEQWIPAQLLVKNVKITLWSVISWSSSHFFFPKKNKHHRVSEFSGYNNQKKKFLDIFYI